MVYYGQKRRYAGRGRPSKRRRTRGYRRRKFRPYRSRAAFKRRVALSNERKFKTVSWNASDVTDARAPNGSFLEGIAMGDDITQRDGRRIYVKGIRIYGYVRHNSTSTVEQKVRLVVGIRRSSMADAATTLVNTTLGNNIWDWWPNTSKWWIVKDRRMHLQITNSPGASVSRELINIYIPIRKFVYYDSTTNLIKNDICYMWGSQSSSNYPLVYATAMVYFRDT